MDSDGLSPRGAHQDDELSAPGGLQGSVLMGLTPPQCSLTVSCCASMAHDLCLRLRAMLLKLLCVGRSAGQPDETQTLCLSLRWHICNEALGVVAAADLGTTPGIRT